MKTFKISAKLVTYLAREIEAKDEAEALEILERLLEEGDMPRADDWLEQEQAEEIKYADEDLCRVPNRLR